MHPQQPSSISSNTYLFSNLQDSQSLVIPGQLGEFVIKCKAANLFSVAGFQGNENLGYFCLQAEGAELYHCGIIDILTIKLLNSKSNFLIKFLQA